MWRIDLIYYLTIFAYAGLIALFPRTVMAIIGGVVVTLIFYMTQ